jgi:hypothetical protein
LTHFPHWKHLIPFLPLRNTDLVFDDLFLSLPIFLNTRRVIPTVHEISPRMPTMEGKVSPKDPIPILIPPWSIATAVRSNMTRSGPSEVVSTIPVLLAFMDVHPLPAYL